ncbi:MAG: GlsB/YeaQ/YmgE family stress response membrane protein [Longimicrobiales bacterium]
MMAVTLLELMVWLIVGLLAGSLAGLVITRKKKGFGRFSNLGVGLAGALIGGLLFDLLKLDLGLADISISLQDIVSAFVGSLLFLGVLHFGRRWLRGSGAKPQGEDPAG